MIACVTSISEKTTELCVWALERNGFEVALYESNSTLWEKLKDIYEQMEEDFIRVDADVIPNELCTPEFMKNYSEWWMQFLTYDWFKQTTTHGGINFIKKEALPYLRAQVHEAENLERPESYMYRIASFHNPRRCFTSEVILGLQNYKNDMNRVRQTKERRKQTGYDWLLVEKLEELA